MFLEAQHIGDGLYGEVATHMQEHLGFGHHLGVYPVGGGVASLLLDNSAEMFGRQAGLLGIEARVAVLSEMLLELGEETGADTLVGVCLVQLALAVVI